MAEKLAIHCVVSGLVQGVWFRASTQEAAKKLGLLGWVRNLPEGTVEVIACGDKEKVLQLHAWIQKGPPRAKVDNVTYEEITWQEFESFEVL
jgi:acylphosphatase